MEKQFVTKDSGQRQEFGTGSVRDLATGKGRYDLIPTMPLRRLAGLYERGAAKYGDRNWEKGQPLMRYVDSAMRHLNCLLAGEPEEDHATAVVWNMFAFMFTLDAIEAGRLPAALDNRPPVEVQYAGAGTAAPPADAPAPLSDAAKLARANAEAITKAFGHIFMRNEVVRAMEPPAGAQLRFAFDHTDVLPDADDDLTAGLQELFDAHPMPGAELVHGAPVEHLHGLEKDDALRCMDPDCDKCPMPLQVHPLAKAGR